jgi:MFS family permease
MTGLATLVGALTALTLVLNEGPAWGFGSIQAIILFAAAAGLFATFLFSEPRVRNALVDFGFFRKRNYVGGNAALLVANFALGAVLFFLPQYMEEVLNYSPIRAGVLLLPLSGLMVVALPLGGKISERIGPRIPIVTGLGLMAGGCYLLTLISGESGYNDVWPGSLLVGAGIGLALTPLNTAAMNAIRRIEHGAAAGVLVTMSGIGATFGVALSGAFFQSVQDSKSDSLLAKVGNGIHLTDAQERTLSGLLSGSKGSQPLFNKFDPTQQTAIKHALRQGYTDGLGVVMWLSLGICVAGLVLVAIVMQRSSPIPDEEEVDIALAEEARA